MHEFKYTNDKLLSRRRDFHVRIALWSMVAASVAIGIFALYGTHVTDSNTNVILAVLAALIVAGIVISAFILAFRHAEEVARSESVLVLTDNNLSYRRSGRPDVQIRLSAISALYSRGSHLIVEGADPRRQIMIPQDIAEFQTLSERLAEHHSIDIQPTLDVLIFARAIIYALCCALVLWSRLNIVTILASAIGLGIVGVESFYLYAKIRQNPKRWHSLVILVCEWLGVVLIACFRIIRT
jgi:hypothetical protein